MQPFLPLITQTDIDIFDDIMIDSGILDNAVDPHGRRLGRGGTCG